MYDVEFRFRRENQYWNNLNTLTKMELAGNIVGNEVESTYCPHDNTLLIKHIGHYMLENHLVNSCCPECGTKIPGVWSDNAGKS